MVSNEIRKNLFLKVAVVSCFVLIPIGVLFAKELVVDEAKDKLIKAQVEIVKAGGKSGIPVDFVFKKDLKFEDYEADVVYLQTILKTEGLYCRQCRITGYFGVGTWSGVVAFQRKYAKEIISYQKGVVSGLTLEKLNRILKPGMVAGIMDCQAKSPASPELLFPEDNAPKQSLSLTLKWQSVSDWGSVCPTESLMTKKYRLRISDNLDFKDSLVDVVLPDSQTSYQVSPGVFSPNTIYHWRVLADNGLLKSPYNLRSFGVSFSPTIDLKAEDSNGPITVNYNNSVTLSWASAQADNCLAFGGWQGEKPVSGTEKITNLTESKNFQLICSGPGGKVQDEVSVEVLPLPTLNLEAFISLDSQNWQDSLQDFAPLNGVDVKFKVSGNATGLVTYRVDCDADGDFEQNFAKVSDLEKTFTDICSYPKLGVYQLAVKVERTGLTAEKNLSLVALETKMPDLKVVSLEKQSKNTYLAKVINTGPSIDKETRYFWLVNYVAQMAGKIPALETGEIVNSLFTVPFPVSSAKIEFRADIDNQIDEASETNNFLIFVSP